MSEVTKVDDVRVIVENGNNISVSSVDTFNVFDTVIVEVDLTAAFGEYQAPVTTKPLRLAVKAAVLDSSTAIPKELIVITDDLNVLTYVKSLTDLANLALKETNDKDGSERVCANVIQSLRDSYRANMALVDLSADATLLNAVADSLENAFVLVGCYKVPTQEKVVHITANRVIVNKEGN